MNEEQFKAWKHSPATQPFLKYLNDAREALKERWAQGAEISDKDHAIAMVYGDIADLEWKDIAQFYGVEDDE